MNSQAVGTIDISNIDNLKIEELKSLIERIGEEVPKAKRGRKFYIDIIKRGLKERRELQYNNDSKRQDKELTKETKVKTIQIMLKSKREKSPIQKNSGFGFFASGVSSQYPIHYSNVTGKSNYLSPKNINDNEVNSFENEENNERQNENNHINNSDISHNTYNSYISNNSNNRSNLINKQKIIASNKISNFNKSFENESKRSISYKPNREYKSDNLKLESSRDIPRNRIGYILSPIKNKSFLSDNLIRHNSNYSSLKIKQSTLKIDEESRFHLNLLSVLVKCTVSAGFIYFLLKYSSQIKTFLIENNNEITVICLIGACLLIIYYAYSYILHKQKLSQAYKSIANESYLLIVDWFDKDEVEFINEDKFLNEICLNSKLNLDDYLKCVYYPYVLERLEKNGFQRSNYIENNGELVSYLHRNTDK